MDDEETTVRAMREAGKTWRIVAAHLGQDRQEVYERYRDTDWNQPLRAAYNLKMEQVRAAREHVPDEGIARAMREAGSSWRQIAEHYGIPQSVVYQAYKDRDWCQRLPPHVPARKANGKRSASFANLLEDKEAIATFWAWVDKDGPVQSDLGPCWPWLFTKSGGYGTFRYRGRNRPAHRVAYRLVKGPIHYAHVDHVCHSHDPQCWGGFRCAHRACVNPDHLESVPVSENIHRAALDVRRDAGAACLKGHLWSVENTLFDSSGRRVCKACVVADATK